MNAIHNDGTGDGNAPEDGAALVHDELGVTRYNCPICREGGKQPTARTGYRCAIGGDTCPGHPSKWLACGTLPEEPHHAAARHRTDEEQAALYRIPERPPFSSDEALALIAAGVGRTKVATIHPDGGVL